MIFLSGATGHHLKAEIMKDKVIILMYVRVITRSYPILARVVLVYSRDLGANLDFTSLILSPLAILIQH